MKLNFIVITLNGYVIERIQIGDYSKESVQDILDKLYGDEFTSKHIGEFVYIDDVAGYADDIDSFVQNRNETHNTEIGYYPDFYVGLEIKTV